MKANQGPPESMEIDTLLERSSPKVEIKSECLAPENNVVHMKKQLGLLDGVAIILGIIIGSGIFVAPTGVIRYTGSIGMSLVLWVLTGMLTMVGAICYAELGTTVPKSGGDYAYINEGLGGFPAFLFLWVSLVVIIPTGNTIMALTFANYILQPFFPNCESPPEEALKLIAAVIICFLTWVNCTNVKVSAKIQEILTFSKVFALLVIIGTGLYYLATGHTEQFQDPFHGSTFKFTSLATASYQGFYAFAGWNCLNFVVEELQNPYSNLPRAIWISIPAVTLIYFLTNVAYFSVLSPTEILSSSAVAVTFGNRTLGYMAWIIPIFVACSTFGSLNVSIFTCSRIFFVGARGGHLPQSLALISIKNLTPITSLLFMGGMSIFMLISSNVEFLINYVSFTESCFVAMSIISLLRMRYKYPDLERPIKVPLIIPIIFLIIFLCLIILPIFERPVELGFAIVVLLTGFPVYWFGIAKYKRPTKFSRIMDQFTKKVQVLTNSFPDEKYE